MTLNFTATESDALEFHKRFYRDSKLSLGNRIRFLFPFILVALLGFTFVKVIFSEVKPIAFWGFVLVLGVLYQRRLDAYSCSVARKQMEKSSCAEGLGACELQLLDEHLCSISPLGTSTYAWASVDRVVMDADYLFIFLVGARGYSIRIAEIGQDTAQKAHDFIVARIRQSQ